MLKPKKKFTRKDIQRDPLLEFLNNATMNLKENKNRYLQIVGGILVAVILVLIISGRVDESNRIKGSNLGLALASLESGDIENARFQFENLVNSAADNNAVNTARYFLAQIRYNSGYTVEAQSLMEDFLDGDKHEILTPKGYLFLASMYQESGQVDKALVTADKGIRKVDTGFDRDRLLLLKVELLFAGERLREANDLNEALLNDKKLDTALRVRAEILSGMMNS